VAETTRLRVVACGGVELPNRYSMESMDRIEVAGGKAEGEVRLTEIKMFVYIEFVGEHGWPRWGS
jgi:hypothetical protein